MPEIWKFLTFTQNLGLNIKEFGTFSHAWSLCVEEHFYLFLPITLIVSQAVGLFKKSYWLLIALFLCGLAIRMYSFDNLYLPKIAQASSAVYWYKYIYYPTYNRLDGLLVGVAIAGLYQFLPDMWQKISKYGNLWIALSLPILTGAYFLCDNPQSYNASVFGFPVVAVGYGLLVVGAISPTSSLYKWNSKITTFIATLSYALYLTHKGIIHINHQLLAGFEIDNNVMLVSYIATCLLGALLLNMAIEKPFMKLRNRMLGAT